MGSGSITREKNSREGFNMVRKNEFKLKVADCNCEVIIKNTINEITEKNLLNL